MLLAPFLGVTWEKYSPIPLRLAPETVNPHNISPPKLKILYETLGCVTNLHCGLYFYVKKLTCITLREQETLVDLFF